MEKVEVNYMGLRKIFESSGNRDQLDALVLNFLNTKVAPTFDEKNISPIPFLKGVELQEKAIEHLFSKNAYILLLHGVCPQESLIRNILHAGNNSKRVIDLYERGLINIQGLQDYLNHYADIDSINYLLDNKEKFKELDFAPIKKRFLYIFNRTHIDISILEAGLKLLKEVPFAENELKWLETYFKAALQQRNFIPYKNKVINFLYDIFKALSLMNIIDLLFSNCNYVRLIQISNSILNIPVYQIFGYGRESDYEISITGFITFIIENEYPHIALAMEQLPLLRERRFEIINGWINRGKALELDIYALPFIEDGNSISSELDDRYNEELQKRATQSSIKDLALAPIDKKGKED